MIEIISYLLIGWLIGFVLGSQVGRLMAKKEALDSDERQLNDWNP